MPDPLPARLLSPFPLGLPPTSISFYFFFFFSDSSVEIELELFVNKTTATKLNSGEDKIEDIQEKSGFKEGFSMSIYLLSFVATLYRAELFVTLEF